MKYGDHLESAAAGLARASAALRDPPPPDPSQRAAAALARVQLYRYLEHHIAVLGAVHRRHLPSLGVVPQPHEWHVNHHSPVTNLAISLRHATASTIEATRRSPANPPVAGAVAVALHDAYQALQLASDILISNTGQPDAATRPRPDTSEGMALLAGVGRDDNLAALARLAAAAAAMDTRVTRWIWPEDAPEHLQPLLVGAEEDAWRVRSGSLRVSALIVAGRGHIARAPVLSITAAPPADEPSRWATLTERQDVIDAVDAARSWLLRHPGGLTIGQLTAASRAALAITHYVGYVRAQTATEPMAVGERTATAAGHWRAVLEAAGRLRSPVPARGDQSTLTVALTSAARWLQEQLRPDGRWREPVPWADQLSARTGWWRTAGEIMARLPDLADLLHEAISRAQARGAVLAATGLRQPGRGLVHVPSWQPVAADEDAYTRLRGALRAAATGGRDVAAAATVEQRPGFAEAAAALTRASRKNSAQLAGEWYPNQDAPVPAKRSYIATDDAANSSRMQGPVRTDRRQRPGPDQPNGRAPGRSSPGPG